MYRKKYKVKGQDVNDYMVMQNFAYHLYSIEALYSFLFKMGYSKKKIAALNINLEPIWQKLNNYNTLLFTQEFVVCLELIDVSKNGILLINCRFFNKQNELCATVTSSYFLNKMFRKVIAEPLSMMTVKNVQNSLEPKML